MHGWEQVCACVHSAHGGQKRVLDLLELELQDTVGLHVGTGHPTQILCKSSVYS